MTDYDKSKVSPRPWRVTRENIGRYVYYVKDAKGHFITGALDSKDIAFFIVHCVNSYDALVKALENSLGWMKKWNETIDDTPYEVQQDMHHSEQILATAKGEE